MLTRFEVDGFKNLRNLAIDLGPYTCVAGANAIGKSNLFDALQFLALTGSRTLNEAAIKIRGNGGDVRDIFAPGGKMSFSAEMITEKEFEDSFGKSITADQTYLRYEVDLELRDVTVGNNRNVSSIVVTREELKPLTKADAREKLGWAKKSFVESAIMGGRRKAFIETSEQERQIHVRHGSQGRPSLVSLSGDAPARTALSVYGQQDQYPVIMAARRELDAWMYLSLEPSAMRAPSEALAPDFISAKGGNLPKTLDRLVGQSPDHDVLAELADIVGDLVDVRSVTVDFDEARQVFTLQAQVGNGGVVSARSLSDGTLRFLVLGTILLDSGGSRLICFEEPENGIHPLKIQAMYWLLHDLSVDPEEAIGSENPLRQVIVNTHSPAFLALHKDNFDELLLGSKDPMNGSLVLTPVVAEGSWRKSKVKASAANVEELLRESFPELNFRELFVADDEGDR